ncbi:MAG TPA: hypothetical protein VFD58_29915 [Blastocatellia bacterium]|nr:hypothetical protein [Blastocatellia bacterium]
MPIKHQQPPEKSLEALREATKKMPKVYAEVAGMIRDILAQPDQHWPHPVYVAGLRDMASANGLRKAQMIGWRYLARVGSDRNYAIEVQHDDDGTDHRLAELDKGPYIDGMYRVLGDKNLARKVGATALRPAVLRINALKVFAVWLRADDPEKELIIPIPPAPPPLKPWQAYTVKEFQDELRDEAKEDLAHDSSDA